MSNNNNNNQRPVQNELLAAYYGVPLVTRSIMTAVIALSLSEALGLVSVYSMFMYGPLLLKGQLWRIFTGCLYVKTGINLLFQLLFLYQYVKSLEQTYFSAPNGKAKADMVYFVLLMIVMLNMLGYLFTYPIMTQGFILSFIYLWSQLNKETIVSFFFGLRFKAMYLPVVILLYDLLSGTFNISSVFGMFCAHVYYFLEEVYPRMPQSQGRKVLQTPQILKAYVPDDQAVGGASAAGSSTGRQQQAAQDGMRHRWAGQGRRLNE
ncbi:hypothetical protein MP228_003718 [Amoeboaphelidium protococcarum]|nr:hypothetical protein MP228_003718 [Amoeboaphelidium protococcarum]